MGEPLCAECPLQAKAPGRQPKFVPSLLREGDNSGIAIVGEQPWVEEAKAGEPFVGKSGKLLNAVLHESGLRRGDVHILNAFSCFLDRDITDADKDKAARVCQPRLVAELQKVSPAVILCLGGTALHAVTDDWEAKITEHAGATLSSPAVPGALVTASYHPSAVLQTGGQELVPLVFHVRKVVRWSALGFEDIEPAGAPAQWKIADCIEDFAFLGQSPILALDTETIGVNRWSNQLECIGVGTRSFAVVLFPGRRPELDEAMRQLLADRTKTFVLHNCQFDLAVLSRHGFPVGGQVEDTMAMHHTLHPKGALHRLSFAAGMYLDVPAWKQEHRHGASLAEGEAGRDEEELALYNGRDVRITAALYGAMLPHLQSAKLEAAYAVQRDNAIMALEISRNGIAVDTAALEAARAEWAREEGKQYADTLALTGVEDRQRALWAAVEDTGAEELSALRVADWRAAGATIPWERVMKLCNAASWAAGVVLDKEIVKRLEKGATKLGTALDAAAEGRFGAEGEPDDVFLSSAVRSTAVALVKGAGCYPFLNLHSDREMGSVIHDWHGLPVRAPANADGSYQVSEEALYHLRTHPLIRTWQAWKSQAKQSTWLAQLPCYPDGRMHPLFKTHVIPTSRWSCGDSQSDDPMEAFNAQNVEPAHLDLFRPADGWALVGADFKTLELRVAAILTGCKNLLEQFRRADAGVDLDLHSQTARRLWPDFEAREKDERKHLRNLAKRAGFLSIYGGGEEALYQKLRIDLPPVEDPVEQVKREEELRSDCSAAQRQLKAAWPELFAVADRWYYDALRDGSLKICYVTGLRFPFPLHDREHVRPTLCANLPVQCTASTLAHLAGHRLVAALRAIPGARVVNYVHDFYMVECPEESTEAVAAIMESAMRSYLDGPAGGLAIIAEPQIGHSWSEVK